MSGALSGKNRKYHADETYEILSNTYNIAVTPPGGIQGAITIPNGFLECLRMLIIPRNSLKFRLLVDSNPTFARSNIEP
jgi:hypothetical protein